MKSKTNLSFDVPTGSIPVNIILGKFQPLCDAVIQNARQIYEETGVETVLCIVNNKRMSPVAPFVTDKMHYSLSNLLMTGSFPFIRGFITVQSADITVFINDLRHGGMEPVLWTTSDTRRYKSYKEIAGKYGEKAGLAKGFEVRFIEVPAESQETAARYAISSCDFDAFLKSTPFRKLNPSEARKEFDRLCVQNAEALNNFKF